MKKKKQKPKDDLFGELFTEKDEDFFDNILVKKKKGK
jgi:hypothetical protein